MQRVMQRFVESKSTWFNTSFVLREVELTKKLTCFKAYDIRGELGVNFDTDIGYRIARAYARLFNPGKVVIGGDVRETSEAIKRAVAEGLQDEGCNVVDIGMVGTEEIYFATCHLELDGGIVVTASHNPINYNGMKLVREDSKPVSGDSGLLEIKKIAEEAPWLKGKVDSKKVKGEYSQVSILNAYVEKLLSYIQPENIKPLNLVVNAGNGASGHVIDAIEVKFDQLSVPVEFIKIHHNPDASFPNGVPNPLLQENRKDTIHAVIEHGADMGIAWDGDFDRCFLFDEKGQFIEGYYIVGLLAEAFLNKNPGSRIIYDPRLIWNTQEIVKASGGTPIMSKTGHAIFKERMRKEDAVYGGELSSHHYFRDFYYCDSGMIPWLLVAELMSLENKPLSSMVGEQIAAYPSSGEINSRLSDPDEAIKRVLSAYKEDALSVDYTDGIGVEFSDWRFNLRNSSTEPVIRLNVESRHDVDLLERKTEQLLGLLRQ